MDNDMPAGYLHTSGSQILDAADKPVRLAGVNWYGFDCNSMVPGGLGRTTIENTCSQIEQLGFNCIRLPFCVEAVASMQPRTQWLDGEPDLRGKTSLAIMDVLIQAAGSHGLRVILDCHRGPAGWSTQENGLWYTQEFPEDAWIAAWGTLAQRYAGNATVIGCDLHNEPGSPPPNPGMWPANGGSLWGFGDGLFGGHRDWAAAATRAGNHILGINPNLLIFVEGVRHDPAGPAENNDSYWFGGNLTGVGSTALPHRMHPAQLSLNVPNRLVYSVHDYGPAMYRGLPWCQLGSTGNSPDACYSVWDKTWGFIAQQGIAPVYLGEFGTPNGLKQDRDNDPPENYTHPNGSNPQGAWFSYLVEYVKERNIHWTYWCINGTQSQAPGRTAGHVEGYGVLDTSWKAVASEPLIEQLRTIQAPRI
jgi:endoglucanase